MRKKLSLCHELRFSSPYIFATQCRRTYIFQTMNYVRSKDIDLKYQKFTLSGCKDIGVRISEFVAKTQFLLPNTRLKNTQELTKK